MPIDVDKALGAELPSLPYSWTEEDVILYHLGLGAGDPPTDSGELRYVYEGDLQVLPTFATIPPFQMMMSVGSVDGVDIDLARVLHGEQETVIHDPIPTSGTVVQEGRVTDIFDKGKGALAILEIASISEKTGEPLFTNRASIYVRGEGGFGGDSGPAAGHHPPARDPDVVVESPTLPQQALLFRMSGDRNPLHADPAFAALAGYERPILHGLCTYGIVAKAVVDHVLDGDTGRVGSYRARFSGVVYPGETIITRLWDQGEEVIVAAETKERGAPVISNSAVICRPTSLESLRRP
jgi:acyl dehydratase